MTHDAENIIAHKTSAEDCALIARNRRGDAIVYRALADSRDEPKWSLLARQADATAADLEAWLAI